jgi:hypothetical protein
MEWIETSYMRQRRAENNLVLLPLAAAALIGAGYAHYKYVELPKKAIVAEFDAKAAREFQSKGYEVAGKLGNQEIKQDMAQTAPGWQTCYQLKGAGSSLARTFKGCVASLWPAQNEGEWRDGNTFKLSKAGQWISTTVDDLKNAVKTEPVRVTSITPYTPSR